MSAFFYRKIIFIPCMAGIWLNPTPIKTATSPNDCQEVWNESVYFFTISGPLLRLSQSMSHCYHINIIIIIFLLSLLGIHKQVMSWNLPVRSVPLVHGAEPCFPFDVCIHGEVPGHICETRIDCVSHPERWSCYLQAANYTVILLRITQ